ncbi:MAG: hypothetical protein H7301_11165 [Cryobacterium sp.]|nr:hypothetical protein [Oligoflexia bacterium]
MRKKPSKASLLRISELTLVGLWIPMSFATAELPNEFEPEYSEAVLEFNAHNYDSTLKMLEVLQKKAPTSVEVLELRAISYRALKNSSGASAAYRELIQMKTKSGSDKKEIAPYAFELGMLRYQDKEWKQADSYFSYSAKNGFNTDLSRFYLGLVLSQEEEWARAQFNLKETTIGKIDEIKPAAHYYLAQVNFKMGYPSRGFENLLEAKRLSENVLGREESSNESRKLAEQVRVAAVATLSPFDHSQWFGNFSALLGYDSNVLLVPSNSVNSSTSSGKATLKSMLSTGVGFASSPLASLQYVPSFRFNLNKNFNHDSSAGEFGDTTASLYLTKNALAPLAYGLKTEGTLVFQNQIDGAIGSSKYRLYDKALTLAPYAKWDGSKSWLFSAEVGYRILNYTGEESVASSLRRSGNGVVGKISAQLKSTARYFHPVYLFRFEANRTEGDEFKSRLYGIQFINSFSLNKFEFAQVLAYEKTNYPNSSSLRIDSLYSLSLLASRKIGPRWEVVVSADLTKNNSSDNTTYAYDRFTVATGVGYRF